MTASTDPIVLARAAYWRGRAAEAAGQLEEMRAQYEAAARYPTAYYGQLARARLGLDDVVLLRSPPEPADGNANELLHARTFSIDRRAATSSCRSCPTSPKRAATPP